MLAPAEPSVVSGGEEPVINVSSSSLRGASSSQTAEIRAALCSFVSHTHNNFTSPLFPLIIVFIKRRPDAYLPSGAESGPCTAKCHVCVCACVCVCVCVCVCERDRCKRRKYNALFHGVLGSESVFVRECVLMCSICCLPKINLDFVMQFKRMHVLAIQMFTDLCTLVHLYTC